MKTIFAAHALMSFCGAVTLSASERITEAEARLAFLREVYPEVMKAAQALDVDLVKLSFHSWVAVEVFV